jgi:hypothetical protein
MPLQHLKTQISKPQLKNKNWGDGENPFLLSDSSESPFLQAIRRIAVILEQSEESRPRFSI